MTFPHDFLWGTSASAYQTEGGAFDDGRGENIWDRFARVPGAVRGGADGAVACDFYHRYHEDIALMHELGVGAFRFSVAWSRVVPDGTGRVNSAGLDFYDRLVDALLAQDIEPWATLYHFDLPQALEDAGGWPARATAGAFADYAAIVASRLGDRVARWVTHNEPFCPSFLGYGFGVHAPGTRNLGAAVDAAHHVLLSHGLAVDAIRAAIPDASVGIVVDSWPAHPASDSGADIAAARVADGIRNRWFFDPLLRGEYPADVLALLGDAAPPIVGRDLETISRPLAFLGVNNYSRNLVAAGPFPWGREIRAPEGELTASGWEIYPPAIGQVLRRIDRDYDAPPLFVTENGAAFPDVRTHDGRIHDVDRIAFLGAYLDEVEAAMRDGVDVHGYFVWSLLDNFEWAEGYSKRFGLVYVDYPTLERIPKQSFDWFRRTIAARKEKPWRDRIPDSRTSATSSSFTPVT